MAGASFAEKANPREDSCPLTPTHAQRCALPPAAHTIDKKEILREMIWETTVETPEVHL